MMLQEFFQQLSYGELSNLAAAVDAGGAIRKDQQNRVIAFVNEGLVRLYSRLPLREESQTLTLSSEEDFEESLSEDVLSVVSLITIDEGREGMVIPVQTHPLPKNVWFHNSVLHIPKEFGELYSELQLVCRYRHATLLPVDSVPEDPDVLTGLAQEIVLPPELHEALAAYVSAKFYSAMNSQEAMIAASGLRARYEQIVAEVLGQGLLGQEMLPSGKLEARGFV